MSEIIKKLRPGSKDILVENIDKLREIFPEVFTEDKIDYEALKETLGEFVEDKEEKYSFTWNGKSAAKRLAQTPSLGTLRPCKEESVNWDNTQNLYIEGDNLEVLKILQKSYFEKVKMIYIDPPYNRENSSDLIYRDNFKDNIKNYKEITSQVDVKGQNISNKLETSGRYHTHWLNMIYPRLKLARNLMTDDGVLFMSIGEQEVHNLRKIADEVFGEQNFIGNAGRISKKANNQGDYWAPNFDYILTYCKKREFCTPFFGGINYSNYTKIDHKGFRAGEKYQPIRLYMTSLDPLRGCNNQRYYIQCPDGSFVIPPGDVFPKKIEDGAFISPKTKNDKIWRWSYSSYLEKKHQLLFKKVRSSNLVDQYGNEAKWNVFTKTYLDDVIKNLSASPNNFIEEHINQKASHELKLIQVPFDFAKPTSLIQFLAKTCGVDEGDTLLDFFSGSATSGHALYNYNLENKINSNFILIQLPELLNDTKKKTKENENVIKFLKSLNKPINLAEVGKERLKRVLLKMSDENKFIADMGFKVFKLDSSNIKSWDSNFQSFHEQLFYDTVNNIKENRSEEDVLYEILLKYGIDLSLSIEEHVTSCHKIYNIGMGALLICLSDIITSNIANDIVQLKNKLNPELCRVVFKDNGFSNDVEKTNTIQILKQANITDVRTI